MVTHNLGCQQYPVMAPEHPGPSSRIPLTPGGGGFPPAIFLDASFSGCFKGENSPLLWSCWRKPRQHPLTEHFLWEITSAFSFPDLFLLRLLIM